MQKHKKQSDPSQAKYLRTPAYEKVRQLLLNSHWQEGQFLSPRKIAREMKISHTPVREAIIRLETEGIVESVPHMGVRPKTLDRDDIRELFEMRSVVESGAARLAAERITNEQLIALRKVYDCEQQISLMHQAMSPEGEIPYENTRFDKHRMDYARLNFLFHLGIVDAARNNRIAKTISDMHLLTRLLHTWVVLPGDSPYDETQRELSFHAKILDSLEKHNTDAAEITMRLHIQNAMDHHLNVFDWLAEHPPAGQEDRLDWPTDFTEAMRKLESHTAG